MSEPSRKLLKMEDGSAVESCVEGGPASSQTSDDPNPKEQLVFDKHSHNFVEVANTKAFVDKSLFIKAFFEGQQITVATVPPRFGRSTLMDMLKQFLLGNSKPFVDKMLKIYVEEREFFDKNCKKHPVIYADFKRLPVSSKEDFVNEMRTIVNELFAEHEYLIRKVDENEYVWSSETLQKADPKCDIENFIKYFEYEKCRELDWSDIRYGLVYLSRFLKLHWEQGVFLLIDGCDAPIINAINNSQLQKIEVYRILHHFQDLLCCGLIQVNISYLQHALVNTCVVLSREISRYAMDMRYYASPGRSNYDEFYGFTVDEVSELLQKPDFQILGDSLDQIQQWYGGYESTNKKIKIYNSYSILSYLEESLKRGEPTFRPYWADSDYLKNVETVFSKPDIREAIEKLMCDKEIEMESTQTYTIRKLQMLKSLMESTVDVSYFGAAELYLQFLAASGYFSVSKAMNNVKSDIIFPFNYTNKVVLKVPNAEIKGKLMAKCYSTSFFRTKYNLDPEKVAAYVAALVTVAEKRDKDAFVALKMAVMELFSSETKLPDNEDELHSILVALAYNDGKFGVNGEFKKMKNMVEGSWRLGILIILGNTGIVATLKFKSESARDAHSAIFQGGYGYIFEQIKYQHISYKIYVGFHLDEKQNVTVCYNVRKRLEDVEIV